ncbi:HNH domain-containing protein [Cephalotus follicularis]|uniref:HNH domain-containing protein n=1 Tax=Cephalotus follicularis TaxID=3775 RepID=A0A1Q3BQL3_CEPFO|nr:HNH domain-containing protein [Cephalotus follicularis]
MRPKNPKRRTPLASSSSPPITSRDTLSHGLDQPAAPLSLRLTPSASLIDQELLTVPDTATLFEDLQISQDDTFSSPNNPRSFPYSVKQQCWNKTEKVKGRDPDRWRRDPLGNTVFRKLVGCPGCLCHDYDHIVPFSKGGKSTLENCQVLQATVNRSKGNRTELSRTDLMERSSYCRLSDRDLDLLELSAYGNVRRAQDSGGCRIQ